MSQTMHARVVLRAVQLHPGCMSSLLLEHLLRGETFGRMAEKGLLDSPYRGALADTPGEAIARSVEEAVEAGWLERSEGYYPSLTITLVGEQKLADWKIFDRREASPEAHYKAYYLWRQAVARHYRKPPYRILTNATLNELASRRPSCLEELLMVPGLGKRRALRYAEGLCAIGAELRRAQQEVVS